jgi:hypothetical protein
MIYRFQYYLCKASKFIGRFLRIYHLKKVVCPVCGGRGLHKGDGSYAVFCDNCQGKVYSLEMRWIWQKR